jgi:hypothetical protein
MKSTVTLPRKVICGTLESCEENMTKSSEPYWDERGNAWTSIDPTLRAIASQLPVRLRRQSQWMAVAVVIGLLFGAMGVLLGLATIGSALAFHIWNFITRGGAIIAVSVILMFATWPLHEATSFDAAQALSKMIDLAIDNAQKILSLIKAGLYCCVIAALFGLVGSAIRTHFGSPPKMPPIVPLTILALVALAVLVWGRKTRLELGKYRSLRQALAVDETVSTTAGA